MVTVSKVFKFPDELSENDELSGSDSKPFCIPSKATHTDENLAMGTV